MREKLEIQTTEFLRSKALETANKIKEDQGLADIEGAEGFFVSRNKPEGETQIILDILANEKGERFFLCQKK